MEALSRSPIYRVRRRFNLTVQKYTAIMGVSIANNLAYLAEVFFRALFLIAIVFIMGQLWKTTYAAHGATLLRGFSINDMIWYVAMVLHGR